MALTLPLGQGLHWTCRSRTPHGREGSLRGRSAVENTPGWSTRQLADLAGTTERAVRHYHQVGLVPEPERRANGYKRYGVRHLVRVLRIRRLSRLGLSLTRVAELGDADGHPGTCCAPWRRSCPGTSKGCGGHGTRSLRCCASPHRSICRPIWAGPSPRRPSRRVTGCWPS
ncbi:MerR family transcriptional regulator [Streptomyces sp. SM1P]